MPIQFQTQLPNVDALALDASVEDQFTANPATSPALNHGEWHVEYRESDAATWTTWGTTNYSTDPTITGLLDGEEYDVRARSQTADVTGAYYTATGVTLLPAPTDVAFQDVEETSLGVAWTDNADNEIEQAVQRRRVDYEMAWATIATVDPNAESDTDAAVQPGREYEYRVQTTTEHVYSNSDAATVETTDLGVPKTRTRRQNWTVEIVAPTGEVLRPGLAGTPQWQPEVTAMPRCRLPVADRPRWHRNDLLESDQTEVRVWYRGHHLPIDSIVRTEPEPGQVTLVCRGASQLDTDVPSEQIDEQETHLALRDLIDEYTDYGHDIDDPASGTRSDVEMIPTANSMEDIRGALAIEFDESEPSAPTVDANIPISCYRGNDFDALELEQTCVLLEAEDEDWQGVQYLGDEDPNYAGGWSGGQAIQLESVGDYVEADVTFNHTIPSGECAVGFLFAVVGGDNPGFDISIDGTVERHIGAGTLTEDDDEYDTSYGFGTATASSSIFSADPRIEVTSSASGSLYVDAVVAYDDRFDHGENLDEDPTDGVLDGPALYPSEYVIETVETSSVEQVLGGRLQADANDTGGQQALGLSNDQGATWKRGQNTDDFNTEFDTAEQQIRGEITLSRWGTQDASPSSGINPTAITSLTLSADLDDTPVLLDQEYSGDLVEICQQAADAGDFVLEARRDPAAAWDDPTGIIIEGAVAGQRSRDRIPEDLVDYAAATTVEQSYDEIVVEGAATDVSGEAFSASSHESLVGLDEGPVVPASETVVDPGDGTSDETVYERGTDYRLTWTEPLGSATNGAIELIESGDMEPGATYEIDYRYTFQGSASSSGVSDPRTRRVEIPDATSDRECDQLALSILKRVQAPLEEAEVTVATDDPTVSLIAALAHPDLPLDDELVIRSSEFGTGEVRYQLGSRQSFADVIEEIESQFRALASRV